MNTHVALSAVLASRPDVHPAPFSARLRPPTLLFGLDDRLEQQADEDAVAVVGGRHLRAPAVSKAPPARAPALGRSGQPLDAKTRAGMEARFGHDFSHVRIHADAAAAASARAVSARAYAVGGDIVFAEGAYAPDTAAGGILLAHELAHVAQQASGRAAPSIQRKPVDDDRIHRPLIERARESMGLLPGEQVSPSEEASIAFGTKYRSPGAPAATATLPACLPVLKNPDWDIAPGPILMSFKGSACHFQLGKKLAPTGAKFGLDGMEFKGKLEIPAACPGKVYYVQYTRPNRAVVGCIDSKPFAECIRPGWGRDGAWPYAFGSVTDTVAAAGTTVDTTTRDSPGQRNISNPAVGFVRICVADEEFVTYLVFEDAGGGLTPLGWMNWKYSARLIRDTGKCPPASTQADCTGWAISGKGDKLGAKFAPGVVGPQPLDKSVKPVSMLSSSCSDSECPLVAPAASSSPPGTSEEPK
ncbi:MAG TPA: DUF4157 domain-containing protein [bacterium]|nr:DUF4157 domain-containing protein [bacterium]